MYEIGETLRSARGRKAAGLKEVEEVTKIRAKYIQALENEDFAAIPGETYVRAFLRTYAQYLDLDEEALIQQYDGEYGGGRRPPSSAKNAQALASGETSVSRSRFRPLQLMVIVVVVAVIAVIAWLAVEGVSDISLLQREPAGDTAAVEETGDVPAETGDNSAGDGDAQVETRDAQAETGGTLAAGSEAVLPTVPSEEGSGSGEGGGGQVEIVAQSTADSGSVEGAAVLTIEAVAGRCWLTLRQDSRAGRPLFAGTLEEGQGVSYAESSEYWVAIGNPSAVEVRLDEAVLEVDEPYGYFRIGPEGVERLD